MKKRILLLVLIFSVLSACNYPSQATPDTNQVATQVAVLLTNTTAPISTATLLQPITPTLSLATRTQEPSPTTTQTSTATTTATPLPTDTPVPSDPALSLGSPTWSNPSNWKGFYFDDTGSEIHYTLSGNDLVLTALHANGWHGWSMTYIKGTNFYLEGTFSISACSGLDRYGLVFRSPDTNRGYFYGVTCDGQYSLRNWIGDGFSENDIVSWTSSPDILAGSNQENRLGVKADGNKYSLYVNGKLLDTVTDDTYLSEGDFGAFIASINTPGLTVTVKKMQFWNLD